MTITNGSSCQLCADAPPRSSPCPSCGGEAPGLHVERERKLRLLSETVRALRRAQGEQARLLRERFDALARSLANAAEPPD